MLAPRAAPPSLLGSLGLVLFVYGIGIQYGKQFFAGVTNRRWAPVRGPDQHARAAGGDQRHGQQRPGPRKHRDVVRKHFGGSLQGTTELSYVSLGVGMALGVTLGVLPIPIPGLGPLLLGVGLLWCCRQPGAMVFASKHTGSDRTDAVYAMTFPTGTIVKILLLQVMLALMGHG